MSDWILLDEPAGLWTAEYRVPAIKSRTSTLRLRDGSYLAYSPGPGLEDAFADHGEASWLIAPNSYHNLGIEAWRERFPASRIAAGRGARTRLASQGHETESLQAVVDDLPAEVQFLEPSGTRIGELWVEHVGDEHVTWFIGDAFFNMKRPHKLQGRLLQGLMRSGPGLSMSHLMKYGGLTDRKAYKTWVSTQLARRRPTRIVPCHGDVLEGDDLADRVQAVLDRRI